MAFKTFGGTLCLAPLLQQERNTRRRSIRCAAKSERARFAVDHTCIDCDTCRWMLPEVYGRVGEKSEVIKQPETEEGCLRATEALLACPTHSIHLTDKQKGVIKKAAQRFPRRIEGTDNVFHCGYHSEKSYGAASYLLKRRRGNVLVDSPRYDATLAKNIKALGGAKYMVLSHRDDVADHAKWAEVLGAQRIIHSKEMTISQGTSECEITLEGEGPWRLPDDGEDVELIWTPGHTEGHIVMLYHSVGNPGESALFTGDHLAFDSHRKLNLMKRYNWFSMEQQVESVAKVSRLPFLHLLPGHGRPGAFRDSADRSRHFNETLASEGFISQQSATAKCT